MPPPRRAPARRGGGRRGGGRDGVGERACGERGRGGGACGRFGDGVRRVRVAVVELVRRVLCRAFVGGHGRGGGDCGWGQLERGHACAVSRGHVGVDGAADGFGVVDACVVDDAWGGIVLAGRSARSVRAAGRGGGVSARSRRLVRRSTAGARLCFTSGVWSVRARCVFRHRACWRPLRASRCRCLRRRFRCLRAGCLT